MRTAVDTNVLVCLLNGEPGAAQVAQALFTAQAQGRLLISGLVYAEFRHPSYKPHYWRAKEGSDPVRPEPSRPSQQYPGTRY